MGLPTPQGHQRDVVYLAACGHQVVLGTAGTGKTVMAIHRAAHLADPRTQNYGSTLLLTYNNSLVTYLRHLADQLPGVTIETYGRFARGYLASQGRMGYNQIAGHCCIDRSAHSISPHLPRQMPCSRARMPGLSWFSTGLWSLLCWFKP
ncbi:MAG: UvrD-helicase domain-containing protein [Pseudonocardiaceae bacterium]